MRTATDAHELSLSDAAVYAGAPLEAVLAAVESGQLPATRTSMPSGTRLTVHSRDIEVWADSRWTQAQLALRHFQASA